ncbi:hypothetical protein D9C73_013138 [Collichthys lucidus]|uniref:Uncharacterized protein n=1 Tax=Collichthys lucidus TaxID=240159 RepID=A0A4U5USD4_COLLU|nr:hypothetical protein D9C73_013138 [Collichthys lucidus]
MKVCMSMASRGEAFSPMPFMRAECSLCFHQDHGPMGFHSRGSELLGLQETHTTPRKSERQALQGQSGATKVSQLHLYLPSSLCDDEEQDTEKEEMRYDF